MNISYKVNVPISTEQFLSILRESSLAERRPVDDAACIDGMINNSNLVITAWDDETPIAIARSLTDFHYACYLSDLAVHKKYQNEGIGKKLLSTTQRQLGPKCKLILVSAPDANSYYKHIGFTNNERCWILNRNECI
ncbi:MAG: GNAT family N-acetyltransferase [Gammaproteobacteria bacterium]|nr:GNAT family N-acetyltransferase [Gammaproteobacteria bacterium]